MSRKRFVSFLVVLTLILSLSPLMTLSSRGESTFDWPQFLGYEGLPGVSDAKTPTSGEALKEMWTKRYGTGWTAVPGTPIVVDNFVYCYLDQKIRKFDLNTGEEVASSPVFSQPVNQFFIYAAYGDGKIYVPCKLNNLDQDTTGVTGCHIRAYDADTLDQLYITESLGGGDMQTPITYHDGFIFTGVYGSKGNYACFDTKDVDINKDNEVKKAHWRIQSDNVTGFKWNGSAFYKDFCIFVDSGKRPRYSVLRVVNYKTGKVIEELALAEENSSSGLAAETSVVYHEKNNRIYISGNSSGSAGILSYEMNYDGTLNKDSQLEYISGVSGGGSQSTPVIYNDRLYLGGGGGIMGSSEPFHVIDANTLEEIYTVPDLLTKGSAAISTAYATKDNGNLVYIYMVPYGYDFGQNESQLWILKDREGQTEPDFEVVSGVGNPQFCSQSIAIAKNGALVWYNDAGYLYCYGNKEDTTITGTDVYDQINRLPELEDFGYYNQVEVKRIWQRYGALSSKEKSKVTNYCKLESIMEIASIDPLTRLNNGIASLPSLAGLNLSDHRYKVESLYKAYENLDEDGRASIKESQKLIDAYGRILYLIEQEAVDAVISKISLLPAVDNITVEDKSSIESALASFNNLDDELKPRVTNKDKLDASFKRIQDIQDQLAKVKDFVQKNMVDEDISLESRKIIHELDALMVGLAPQDIQSITEYEQYVSPAKADLVNLMVAEFLMENDEKISVTPENAKELSALIEEIETFYAGILEEDKLYLENYDILLSVKKDLEGQITQDDPKPPSQGEEKLTDNEKGQGDKPKGGDKEGNKDGDKGSKKPDSSKNEGNGKTVPKKTVSPSAAKKSPQKNSNQPLKITQYVKRDNTPSHSGFKGGDTIPLDERLEDDEPMDDEDELLEGEDESLDDESPEDSIPEDIDDETTQNMDDSEDNGAPTATAIAQSEKSSKKAQTLPIVVSSLAVVLAGIAVFIFKTKKPF